MTYRLELPLERERLLSLKAGDSVTLTGWIYAARDAAHKRMTETLEAGGDLPFEIKGQMIYYVGPCPARPGKVIGSAGPTTSGRMDAYAPILIEKGLWGMIGKGARSNGVTEAMTKFGAVYFGAIGGAGALIAQSIVEEEIIAYPELGPEALRKLRVKDFPAVVIIDSQGNNLYETGRRDFQTLTL